MFIYLTVLEAEGFVVSVIQSKAYKEGETVLPNQKPKRLGSGQVGFLTTFFKI